MAAEAYFVEGIPVEKFITEYKDAKVWDRSKQKQDPMYEFMITTKIPRSSRLVTCPVKIDGYEYDLKNGYDKLPSLREVQKDSHDEEFEVMHITTKKITIDKVIDTEITQDMNLMSNIEGELFVEKDFAIHIGPETEQNRVARYFVSNSTSDPFLIKIMPELESKPGTGERLFSLEAGYHVGICTNADDFDWDRVNFEYYIKEAEKLIDLPERSIGEL